MPSAVLIAVAVCALSCFIPYYLLDNKSRDEKFYQPLPDLVEGKFRSGTVLVTHSDATLLVVSDSQGPSPADSVNIAYHTSYSSDKPDCDTKKHILLIHGTGFNKNTFHWTKSSLSNAGGYDGLASALPPQLTNQSIVSRLHSEPGVCITTIDLRGHGDSSVPAGPWSVRLLAADVAEALQLIHGSDVKVHAYGHSVGFGTALSIAFNYPQLLLSVSGGGFLAGMKSISSWPGYIFSRESIVNMLGMELLASAGASVILVSTATDFLKETMRFVRPRGYLYTSQSWLNYDESNKLRTMKVPVLWLHPIKDDLTGATAEKVVHEFTQLPTSNKKKLVVYNRSGDEDHCYPYLDPDRYFGDIIDFIKSE